MVDPWLGSQGMVLVLTVCFSASCLPCSRLRLLLLSNYVALGHALHKVDRPQVFVDLLVWKRQVAFSLFWTMSRNCGSQGNNWVPARAAWEPSLITWKLGWGCHFFISRTLRLFSVFSCARLHDWVSLSPVIPQCNRDNSCSTHALARMRESYRGLVAF